MLKILDLKRLTPRQGSLVITGLFLIVLPVAVILGYALAAGIEGPNPFLMLPIFFVHIVLTTVGIVMYLIGDRGVARKTITIVVIILFQLLILPAIWAINDVKLSMFVYYNRDELELVANNVIDKTWTSTQATSYLKRNNIPLRFDYYNEGDQSVLFVISGIIDNCHGIAFSRTGQEPATNGCGDLISWTNIIGNWYEWSTT